jgi:hypothetical protein
VELQKFLQQERERSAGRLEQNLAAARRDVEAQTAKATEEVQQWKQPAEAGAAELKQSMQGAAQESRRTCARPIEDPERYLCL